MAGRSLKEAMSELTTEDKQQMTTAITKFNAAKRGSGDVQAAFNEVWYTLKGIETKYNVTIFVPGVPETQMVDMIASKVETKVAAMVAPGAGAPPAPSPAGSHYVANFACIAQANDWLARQNNLNITNMQVGTSHVGLDITQIRIEYQVRDRSVSYVYQICEEMKHRIFAGSNHEKFRNEWERKNPGLKYVFSIKKKWGFSLLGGSVGFFRYIKEKYIVLYARAYK